MMEPPADCPPLKTVGKLATGEGAPCYLPQPDDELPSKNFAEPMGPIGE